MQVLAAVKNRVDYCILLPLFLGSDNPNNGDLLDWNVFTYLNCSYTSQCPQITMADPGEFLLNLLHEAASNVQAIVSAVESLRLETHGSIVAGDMRKPIIQKTFHALYTPAAG